MQQQAERLVIRHEEPVSSEALLQLVAASRFSAVDCECVAAAQQLRVPLVTADEQLEGQLGLQRLGWPQVAHGAELPEAPGAAPARPPVREQPLEGHDQRRLLAVRADLGVVHESLERHDAAVTEQE